MALWSWSGAEWDKALWHKLHRPDRAVLYGCGPSLADADPIEKGAVRFVQNHAFRKVDPHIWIGMDKPDDFGADLLAVPCRKVFRGNYSMEPLAGKLARDFGDVYFADVAEMPKSQIWFGRGPDIKFLWTKNTMTVALHMILWMGFREIVFSGIDLGGHYFDNRELTGAQKAKLDQLFNEEYSFLQWFAETAKANDVRLINRSKTSRLADIMETV